MTTRVGITFVYYQTTAHSEITRIRFPRWRRSAIGIRKTCFWLHALGISFENNQFS